MHRRHSLLLVVVATLMFGGCGMKGTSRPASIPQPDLDARLMHDIFFGSGSTAPATVEVTVVNRGAVPIAVRRIEIDSPGMVEYGFYRTQKLFNEKIGPGETKPIGMVVTAYTTTSRPRSEPLTIRAIVEFEAGGTRWREILMARQ